MNATHQNIILFLYVHKPLIIHASGMVQPHMILMVKDRVMCLPICLPNYLPIFCQCAFALNLLYLALLNACILVVTHKQTCFESVKILSTRAPLSHNRVYIIRSVTPISIRLSWLILTCDLLVSCWKRRRGNYANIGRRIIILPVYNTSITDHIVGVI